MKTKTKELLTKWIKEYPDNSHEINDENFYNLIQQFVKKLSGNSAIIYEFFDIILIFSRVWVNTEHVKKSFQQ